MSEIKQAVQEIKSIQRNIDQLLDEGLLTINRTSSFQFSDADKKPVGLKMLLAKKECHVLLGSFSEVGAQFPPHLHNKCGEYFIVVKGSMVIDLGNGVKRIMKERSCACVDENTMHSVHALEPDTEYVVISIPLDEHISNLFDKVNISE